MPAVAPPSLDPVVELFAPWFGMALPTSLAWWTWAVMIFVQGLLFGSFFNVCIYRVPMKKSIVRPGSHCYSCGSPLRWRDNVPILGYLMLRGNCRDCGAHFSARYAFVEALTGALFLATYWQFGPHWTTLLHLVFISLLLVGIFTDLDHFILPDGITVGGLIFGLLATAAAGRLSVAAGDFALSRDAYHSFADLYYLRNRSQQPLPAWWVPMAWSAVSAAAGYGMLWGLSLIGTILFRKDAMGAGDIKLFAFLGAYLGALNSLFVLALSAALGAVFGISLLVAHKLLHGDELEEIVLSGPAGDLMEESSAGLAGIVVENVPRQWPGATGGHGGPGSSPVESASQRDEGVTIRVAGRTSSQMATIPYGPYIAAAAFLILLGQPQIVRAVRHYLILGPETPVARWTDALAGLTGPDGVVAPGQRLGRGLK